MTQFKVDAQDDQPPILHPRTSTPRQAVQPRMSIHDEATQISNSQQHHAHQPRQVPLHTPQPQNTESETPMEITQPRHEAARPLPPIPQSEVGENALQVQALLEEQKKLIKAIEFRGIAQGQEAYKLAAAMSIDNRRQLIRAYEEEAEKRAYTTLMEAVAREEETTKPSGGVWERVAETGIVEMESSDFLIAGTGPKVDRHNYQWKFGREDGQFRCALGHNTQFKSKKENVDPATGSKPVRKWR